MATKEEKKMKKEIGKRYKAFRLTLGKSQEQLAEEVGIDQSQITHYESGNSFPPINHLYYLAVQYRLNINWLVSEGGEMFLPGVEKTNFISLPIFSKEIDAPRLEKYLELRNLMNIPIIESIILGKLSEIKLIAKKEIEDFFKEEKLDKKKPELPENTNNNQD